MAILLLAVFLFPFAARYTGIKYQVYHTKKKIKRQMIAGIDRSELVVMKFSKAEADGKLNWKHSKEFELGGEWYDIVYTDTLAEDSLQYWLFWDYEETKLNKELAKLVAEAFSHDVPTKEKNAQFKHFSQDIFCIELTTVQHPLTLHGVVRYSLAGASPNRPVIPLAPPPELV